KVFIINDKYVLKICTYTKRDKEFNNEINFLERNNTFSPSIYYYDLSRRKYNFSFSIEEKVKGGNLLVCWQNLNTNNKVYVLDKILEYIFTINKEKCSKNILNNLLSEFNNYIKIINDRNILTSDQLDYLQQLKNNLEVYLTNSKQSKIHGDLHFNNIIYNDKTKEIKIIDYEKFGDSFLDKEFDPINRMCRRPNSFIKNGIQNPVNVESFKSIMPYIKENYFKNDIDSFENDLLIYDCLNSLMWLPECPNDEIYNNVIFYKTKKLL
ncbi:MAG: hypothetical protein RR745_06225, partial [Bacilli bacterium]